MINHQAMETLMKLILLALVVVISACAEAPNKNEVFANALLEDEHLQGLEVRLHEAREGDTCSFSVFNRNDDGALIIEPIRGEIITGFTGYDTEGYGRAGGIICRLTDVGNRYGMLTWSN